MTLARLSISRTRAATGAATTGRVRKSAAKLVGSVGPAPSDARATSWLGLEAAATAGCWTAELATSVTRTTATTARAASAFRGRSDRRAERELRGAANRFFVIGNLPDVDPPSCRRCGRLDKPL